MIDWDDLIVLIGDNNCGKSSILLGLSIFLTGGSIRDPMLFRNHRAGEDDAIELIGYFDQISPFELEQSAVRGRTHNGEWILKKRYWSEAAGGAEEERITWKDQLYSFSAREEIIDWPNDARAWRDFPE